MTVNTATVERRKFPRNEARPRFAINLLKTDRPISASSVNFSEGGLCLQLQELLEIRSLVRLQFTPKKSSSAKGPRALECTGRVAWVIQRLDLRDAPPFLYDVGIEFVDPPRVLRQLIVQRGGRPGAAKEPTSRAKSLDPVLLHSRYFVPRLEREPNPPQRWHLVVSVDGTPCFSSRYPSERVALAAWAKFQRERAKR